MSPAEADAYISALRLVRTQLGLRHQPDTLGTFEIPAAVPELQAFVLALSQMAMGAFLLLAGPGDDESEDQAATTKATELVDQWIEAATLRALTGPDA